MSWHPDIPEHYRGRIVKGDALSLLRALPDGCVDGCFTDPPYSSGGIFRADRQGDPRVKYQNPDQQGSYATFSGDNRDQRSYAYWCALWLSECLRVTRVGGILAVFTDWRQLPTTTDAIQSGGWVWRGIVPWDKTEGVRPQKGRYSNQCEYVVWGSKGPMTADETSPCLPGCIRLFNKAAEKIHIAGKPVGLMRLLLQIVPKGGLILDPFAGAGSTLMACAEEGYRFIGFEIDGQWTERANDRAEASGLHLFAGEVA